MTDIPAALPIHPFLTRECTDWGVSRRRLNGPEFRPVLEGVAVAAHVPDTVVVRARAALLVAPEGAVVSHWTAARIWGGVVPDNEWTHVSFMRDVRFRVRGVKPHRFRHRLDVRRWQGVPVTSPMQTFCHLARFLGLVDLVVLGDRLLRKSRFTQAELTAYADGWLGQCRREAVAAASLVRDRVDSPPETMLRILLVLAGLPEPEVDIPIRDAEGRVRFRIDLGYESVKLAIEYDGRWHAAPEEAAHDEARRDHLTDVEGWHFEVVTAEDLYDSPEDLLIRLVAAMVERGLAVPTHLSNAWRRHFRVVRVAAA